MLSRRRIRWQRIGQRVAVWSLFGALLATLAGVVIPGWALLAVMVVAVYLTYQ